MTTDIFIILKHQLGDENPQDDFDTINAMTREETLAYVEAEGKNTTENILKLYDEVKAG